MKPGTKKPTPQAPDPLATWQEQLRRGGLDLAILLSLSSASRYGLEIIRDLEESTDLVVTEGTIYPILGRLTRNGVLEAAWVSETLTHPRKYYRLTDLGWETLDRMLEHWTEFRTKIDQLAETVTRSES